MAHADRIPLPRAPIPLGVTVPVWHRGVRTQISPPPFPPPISSNFLLLLLLSHFSWTWLPTLSSLHSIAGENGEELCCVAHTSLSLTLSSVFEVNSVQFREKY